MGCFADDPAEYFRSRSGVPHHLSREEQESLQLEALQKRFGALRDAIPPLKALADAARMDEIRRIDEIAPLLFPHSFYKSFPQHLIHQGRFDALGAWLGRLTTHDISALAGRRFGSIDGWMDAIDGETELEIMHSSGTTGALSLYPRGKGEAAAQLRLFRMLTAEWLDPVEVVDDRPDYAVIWPSYSGGRSAILKGAGVFREGVARDPSLFFSLIPAAMSSDWQIYVLEMDQARRRGDAPPVANDYVRLKMAEAEEFRSSEAERMSNLLDTIRRQLNGTRVVIAGGPANVHRVASEGIARGMTPGLAPGSIVRTFGGLKGLPQPENMEATIKRFAGVARIGEAYGMTEVSSPFNACADGNFHIPPWVIPLVLDPASGVPQPRQGNRRGRAAFVDLVPRSYWGGVVSADIVEMGWGRCGCGRTSPHVKPGIVRLPGRAGDEYRIGASTEKAIHSALYALTRDIEVPA